MAAKDVIVVEIGSSKLACTVASKGVNGIFNIKANAKVEYAGFFEGEFIEPALLEDAMRSLFSQISSVYKKEISQIYVGVPAEFSKVASTKEQLSFKFKRGVRQSDLSELCRLSVSRIAEDGMEVLSINPLYYILDDARKTNMPLGVKAGKVMAEFSVVLAQSRLISTFNKIFTRIGVAQVEYLSEPLSEAMMVLEKEERDRTCIVIDVGARSTSVAFVKGDGLTNLTSFSMGGSHITSDLSEACGISYNDASNLKRQIVLSLRGGDKDFYELITLGGKVEKIPLELANAAVCYRLDLIAKTVNECIRLFAKEYVPYYPIYLSGAGVSKIKGGKDYFAKCISRNISYGVPPIPAKDKPENASMFGLLNKALENE